MKVDLLWYIVMKCPKTNNNNKILICLRDMLLRVSSAIKCILFFLLLPTSLKVFDASFCVIGIYVDRVNNDRIIFENF